jgi:hypothetical protein
MSALFNMAAMGGIAGGSVPMPSSVSSFMTPPFPVEGLAAGALLSRPLTGMSRTFRGKPGAGVFGIGHAIHVTTFELARAARKARERTLRMTAARIRRASIASIEQLKGPSQPGRPPHTHKRTFLRRAIAYSLDMNRQGAVIGPRAAVVGRAMEAHEYGGDYKGKQYPARPFMNPALRLHVAGFAGSWSGSIH